MRFTHAIILILMLAIAPIAQAQDSAADSQPVVDWTNPETLDPMNPTLGSFLDIDLQAWQRTASEAYQSGDYEKAAKYYLAYVRCNVQDAQSVYNLACCYGLMGDADLAASYLKRAVKAGFTDIGWIQKDTDFDNVRGTEVFDTTMATLETEAADREAALGERIFTESSAMFGCRIRTPENFDPSQSHTLVIGLHGYGDNADHFIGLWKRFTAPDFIFAAPETPYPFTGGSQIGYSWGVEGPGVNEELWRRSMEMTDGYIANLVSDLKRRYQIDRVFLLGFSQGAFLTYTTGIRHHDLFTGLIVFGGGLEEDGLTDEELAAGKDLRIFIAHGNEDQVIEYQLGVQARDKLMAHGYDVTWHEFAGGHTVQPEALQAAEEWMKRMR